MKRSEAVKFPNSVQLFKFCHRVLSHQKGKKVNDQDVGGILEFNPSDCSHWKRGEKNVRSVFSLAKLADTLQVEPGLIHDVAGGALLVEEAYFEYSESLNFKAATAKALAAGNEILKVRQRIESFIANLHHQSQFTTPPLYLPEVLRFFAFIQTQPADIIDRLTRILRLKPGQYMVQYRKGDLKAQTRMSLAKDLARIIFEAERGRFPELGTAREDLLAFEQLLFVAGLLVPKHMLLEEMGRLDNRRNLVNELAALFWVPKSLIGFQLQEVLRANQKLIQTPSVQANTAATLTASSESSGEISGP